MALKNLQITKYENQKDQSHNSCQTWNKRNCNCHGTGTISKSTNYLMSPYEIKITNKFSEAK